MFKVLAQKDIASPLAHYISRSLPDESEVKAEACLMNLK